MTRLDWDAAKRADLIAQSRPHARITIRAAYNGRCHCGRSWLKGDRISPTPNGDWAHPACADNDRTSPAAVIAQLRAERRQRAEGTTPST